jgi:shikimate kinase
VLLIGLPGSGKTTLARGIARAFSLVWIDLDHEIERRSGVKVAELFAQSGEAAFRELERATLADMLNDARHPVVSTGGGVVTHEPSRTLLRGCRQPVVYLHASPMQVAPRIRDDGVRPMFVGKDPLEVLSQLYRVRDPLYREAASDVVEVGDGNVRAAQDQLAAIWRRGGGN